MILDHDGGTVEAEKYKNIGISEQWKRRLELEPNVEIEKRSLTLIEYEKKPIENKNKSFQCEMCGSSFVEKNKMKAHIATVHEGKKAFECDICASTFARRSSLNQHIATVHEEKKAFQCELCHKEYTDKRNLKYHVTSIHSG